MAWAEAHLPASRAAPGSQLRRAVVIISWPFGRRMKHSVDHVRCQPASAAGFGSRGLYCDSGDSLSTELEYCRSAQ